jgi:hypothetical protein
MMEWPLLAQSGHLLRWCGSAPQLFIDQFPMKNKGSKISRTGSGVRDLKRQLECVIARERRD